MKLDAPGIYSIKNNISNKIYIGSAINLERRFGEHLRMLHRNDHDNTYLQAAWNKYGEKNFEFKIECLYEKKELILQEQRFIDAYKEQIGWRNMYNLSPVAGSQLGMIHTQESLDKMSKQQSGKNNGFYGKKHSEETIQKLKKVLVGRPAWNKGKEWSDDIKQKISTTKKGTVMSEETKTKISEALKGRVFTETQKKSLANSRRFTGKHHTEEAKEKIRVSMKKKSNRLRNERGQFEKSL